MTNPQTDLETTVERVRVEKFPALPSDLVSAILKIEKESVENRSEAMNRVRTVIQAFLDAKDVK